MQIDGRGHVGHEGTLGVDMLRVGCVTALILLVPLVAMQFTQQVRWTGFDFAVAAVLLAGAGLGSVRLLRRTARLHPAQRWMLVGALALVFAAVWVELAVGVFFHFGS